MTQKIIIAGSGFAGMWAALAASRAIALAGKENEIEVSIVSPTTNLVIRPRLYEAEIVNMDPDIGPLLKAVGVRHIAGLVETVDAGARAIKVLHNDGRREVMEYARFILAVGSQVSRPSIPGLEYAFDADQLESARALDAHIRALPQRDEAPARNVVVIAGGGLTGIEAAAEMPIRLRAAFGDDAGFRVVMIDTASLPGGSMGEAPLPFVAEALTHAGVETRTESRVVAMDAESVTLSTGERIETNTVVWTAGMRAHPLAGQIAGPHDGQGRVIGDAYLHAPNADGIFVTGDTVKAATDEQGNFTVMSCQHALGLGRVAGYNAAAELLDLPLHVYRQPKYVTCIDLGDWGALYTEGWDRQVHLQREDAKALKRQINGTLIYPPAPDRETAFAIANPDFVIVA